MKILIVEDDARIAEFILKGLRAAGYTVSHASDGNMGLEMALSGAFDAGIVDIMLPGRDGLSLLQELRRSGGQMPVIILSAKQTVDDKIRGLQAGGDDYLTKPFSFSELLARLMALLRRKNQAADARFLTFGDLTLDLRSREVSKGGVRIELQSKEFALLEYFMRHPRQILSKAMILEQIWDYDFDPQTNVVDVLVCRLRNRLETIMDRQMIRTVRGVGYVLKDD